MALLKGEGTHQILYGGADIFSGLRHNRGYLTRPDHAGSFPTVLLVHGTGGITSSVKSLARRLARHGLAVIGPDLLRGARTLRQPEPAWPLSSRIAADLLDAFRWMASADTPWVRPGPIGVLSLDRAAPEALRFAAECDCVGALALISPVLGDDVPSVQVPVIGFHGKEDEEAGPGVLQAARGVLGHGEWVLYGGIGRGLVDEAAPEFRWDVAEDVIDRIVEFFGRPLKP